MKRNALAGIVAGAVMSLAGGTYTSRASDVGIPIDVSLSYVDEATLLLEEKRNLEVLLNYISVLEAENSVLMFFNNYYEGGARQISQEIDRSILAISAISALTSLGVLYDRRRIKNKAYEQGLRDSSKLVD